MVAITNLEVGGGAASLALPSGDLVLFDEADQHLIDQYRWSVMRRSHTNYVRGYIRGSRAAGYVQMHRILLDLPVSDVDHVNGNGLDNRRVNLRTATRGQNNANRSSRVGQSGYRGVVWHRQNRRWVAQISVDNKTQYLGSFDDPWDAAQAYNARATELWDDFVLLNVRHESGAA